MLEEICELLEELSATNSLLLDATLEDETELEEICELLEEEIELEEICELLELEGTGATELEEAMLELLCTEELLCAGVSLHF